MLSTSLLSMSLFSAFMPWTFAQTSTPTPPGLTYLYTANVTLSPAIEIGDGPRGFRVAIPIIGGTFTGPKLKGKWRMSSSENPFKDRNPRC